MISKKLVLATLISLAALPFGSAGASEGGLDVSPYADAQQCLLQKMTPAQRNEIFTIGRFNDWTGQVNLAAESGHGDISTQGLGESWYFSLGAAGASVADTTKDYQDYADWIQHQSINNLMVTPGNVVVPLHTGTQLLPHTRITGGIITVDTGSGDVAEASFLGIGGGYRRAWMDIAIVTNVWQESYGTSAGNRLVDTFRIYRRVYTSAFKADAGILAHGLITADFMHQHGADIQYTEATMVDQAAVLVLARHFGISACNDAIAQGDRVESEAPSDMVKVADRSK